MQDKTRQTNSSTKQTQEKKRHGKTTIRQDSKIEHKTIHTRHARQLKETTPRPYTHTHTHTTNTKTRQDHKRQKTKDRETKDKNKSVFLILKASL